jgi:DNA-binding transcriptional LysR family regulator
MELRHLRYLAAVADAGNFGRAAARLGITQPPLSRQIQILERELGIALLTRTGRRVRPTAAGERFLAEARDILAAAERAADTARRSSPAVSGTIAVGTLQTSLLSVLFRVLGGRRAASDPSELPPGRGAPGRRP